MLEPSLNGVSTRRYETALPPLARPAGHQQVGSLSADSRRGPAVMRELAERRLKELEVLALHLNGTQFGDYHDPAAAGVDAGGRKQVMGPCGRAPDNTTVTRRPLKALVARASESHYVRLFHDSPHLLTTTLHALHAPNALP